MNATVKLVLAGVALPLFSGCALGQIGSVMHPTVTGSITVRLSDGAQSTLTPDRCQSGDWNYFLGFDFSSAQDQGQLRAIKDPTGDVVVRWTTPQGTRVLRASDCSQLALDIRPTGWRVNEVREFAGRVELQCQSADGASITGRLTVDHCH